MAIYDDYQDVALAGMKADSGFDRVESFAAGGDIPFGVVVSRKSSDSATVVEAGADEIRGVSVHSHAVPGAQYVEGEAVSVMTRGVIWGRVAAGQTPVEGTLASVDASGLFQAEGVGADYPNAVFRGAKQTITEGDDSVDVVLVELGNPYQADPA